MIVDLSYPAGASVNDGIDSALCSLRYTKVEEIASAVLQLGKGTELTKADIKAAYRIVPVHPEDRHLLAMRWYLSTSFLKFTGFTCFHSYYYALSL